MSDDANHAEHSVPHYNKILILLMVLATVSWVGPMVGEQFGLKWVTMISAFGIAFYKAYLVCKNFMHLNVERRYVVYLLTTGLALMFLFFAGTAPDIMNHEGRNWINVAAQHEIERATKANAEAGGHHGEGDHAEGDHAEDHGEGAHGAH